jgi:hypothetical protein
MDKNTSLHVLQTMIEYFEAGNKETDAAAKSIIEWDFEYADYWEELLRRYRKSGAWTRIRSPEAELVALALRDIQALLERGKEEAGGA